MTRPRLGRAAGLVLVAAALLAAACDEPAPRYRQARAPEPAPIPTGPPPPPAERHSPIGWDAERKAFVAHGRPLAAARLWTFDGAAEGWTSSPGMTLTPAPGGGLQVQNGAVDPNLLSPTGLGVDGGRYPLVVVRLTRLGAGANWTGELFYSTSAHGADARYRGRPADGESPEVNETVTLVYDMAQPGAGGPDWSRGVIDQLRLDTDDGAGGGFLIRQVAVVERPAVP